jgi:hypothetical protein
MPTCIVLLSCFYTIRRRGSPPCFSSNILLCAVNVSSPNGANTLKHIYVLGHGTSLSKTSEVIISAPIYASRIFPTMSGIFSRGSPSTHEHHSWRSLLASCRRHLPAQSTAKTDRLVLPLHCSGPVLIWR